MKYDGKRFVWQILPSKEFHNSISMDYFVVKSNCFNIQLYFKPLIYERGTEQDLNFITSI